MRKKKIHSLILVDRRRREGNTGREEGG